MSLICLRVFPNPICPTAMANHGVPPHQPYVSGCGPGLVPRTTLPVCWSWRVVFGTPCSRAARLTLRPALTASKTASIDSSAHCLHFPRLEKCKMAGADFKQILLGCPCDRCLCLPPCEDGITTGNSENNSQSVTIPTLETTNTNLCKWLCWKTAVQQQRPFTDHLIAFFVLVCKPSKSFFNMYIVDSWYWSIIGNLCYNGLNWWLYLSTTCYWKG